MSRVNIGIKPDQVERIKKIISTGVNPSQPHKSINSFVITAVELELIKAEIGNR